MNIRKNQSLNLIIYWHFSVFAAKRSPFQSESPIAYGKRSRIPCSAAVSMCVRIAGSLASKRIPRDIGTRSRPLTSVHFVDI